MHIQSLHHRIRARVLVFSCAIHKAIISSTFLQVRVFLQKDIR